MNVCHIGCGFHGWGGIARMVMDFFNHPQNAPFVYHLVTTSSSENFKRWAKNAGTKWFEPERDQFILSRVRNISNYIKQNNIQIIHSYNAEAGIWALFSELLIKKPLLLIAHEHGSMWYLRPNLRWLDFIAKKRSKYIIANSRASVFLLQKLYNLPPQKIKLVYNFITVTKKYSREEARQRLGLTAEAEVVGSVGRLDTPKDYWTLIDAARLVIPHRKKVNFVLIGGGPQEMFLKGLIQDYGLTEQFHLLGSRDDAPELIAGFDLFVSTSFRESFGNVLIEAALQEKAVIAPAVDGIPEAVEDGVTGVLLQPSLRARRVRVKGATPMPKWVVLESSLHSPRSLDPKLLAETIIQLLDDPDKRNWMGVQGRARAEKVFNIHRYISDLEKIYLESFE
ncbi:glycosyltransferase [Bellilinea caldifistulae]|uniref:Glycosyltransferase family 1 protein n=1 Tax=Bellilinea caldifistulae TaxID=360411 RepID=A0A0P6Y7K7_9CHLR|nr:glycosyltransferase family 4 protein [Bellilinea caldifistulae]KPL77607.1 hypothetical protein AC812_03510 [Bellilinea caldifistulae]GAP09594.1 glycosyltransferase [Bellilinea caldifistulae]